MRALVCKAYGPPESLVLDEQPDPIVSATYSSSSVATSYDHTDQLWKALTNILLPT